MSHEKFEKEYEEFEQRGKKEPIVLKDLPYRNELESSCLSVKGLRNIQLNTPIAVSGTDTAATSGVHQYFASRQLFGSMAFGGDNGPTLAMTVDDSESKTAASG
jgi:hypothetical protein